jgi:hypothetical protein
LADEENVRSDAGRVNNTRIFGSAGEEKRNAEARNGKR